jgi:hypothetical protein
MTGTLKADILCLRIAALEARRIANKNSGWRSWFKPSWWKADLQATREIGRLLDQIADEIE